MMTPEEQKSWEALFPVGTRVKDVQDALFFTLTCFDQKHPNYTPQYQKHAIKIIRQTLGVKKYRR